MKQKQHHSPLILSLCGSLLLLSACSPQSEQKTSADSSTTTSSAAQSNAAAPSSAKADPVKTFAATADDMHDIALIDEFHEKFNAMSLEFEADLRSLRESNNLSAEMQQQRQLDHAQSALTMLNALELKTEQGRYIQGLLYQYWEKQVQHFQALDAAAQQHSAAAASEAEKDLLTAQAQFKHWKLQL